MIICSHKHKLDLTGQVFPHPSHRFMYDLNTVMSWAGFYSIQIPRGCESMFHVNTKAVKVRRAWRRNFFVRSWWESVYIHQNATLSSTDHEWGTHPHEGLINKLSTICANVQIREMSLTKWHRNETEQNKLAYWGKKQWLVLFYYCICMYTTI